MRKIGEYPGEDANEPFDPVRPREVALWLGVFVVPVLAVIGLISLF